MKSILASDIQVSDSRQRKNFSEASLVELSQSIQTRGLIHAIVCRTLPDGKIELVAGERRLRAMKMLLELDIPIQYENTAFLGGTVPTTMLEDLSAEAAYAIELEENIIREDISWQERASALARLNSFRQTQSPDHTLRDTVREVRGDEANNWDFKLGREDLLLAKNLSDPDVAKAPSRKEALKVLEKKAKTQHRAKLAQLFDASASPHTLLLGDSLEWLKSLPAESVHCLLTDPPYGMDASDFGDNFAESHDYTDTPETFKHLVPVLAEESFRILKPNTHVYVFCNFEGYAFLESEFRRVGFSTWMQPLIWSKGNGNAPWIENGHKKTYECILFASKGKRPMTTVKPDVLTYPTVTDRDHAAQKPVALIADLLARSINPGEIVIDPFCGSGTIFEAANLCSCVAWGVELSEKHYNTALLRLKPLEDALL